LTISVAHSSFVLEWDPSRDSQIALVAQSFGILPVKYVAEAFRPHFLFRQARVVQYCLICGQKCAVSPERDDELRDGIDDGSKFSFGFRKLFERTRERRVVALARIDIRLQDEPTEDAALRIPHRQTLRMEPSVDAIRAPLAELDVVRLPAFD
jgi:hypothetical protein